MLWEARLSRDGFSIDAAIEKGRDLPDWYLEEPQLLPGEEFYTQAFGRLTTCRTNGMEPGPIPWDKRIEYAERAGLDGDMVNVFVDILGAMDDAYLEHMRERAKKDADAKKPKGKRGSVRTR